MTSHLDPPEGSVLSSPTMSAIAPALSVQRFSRNKSLHAGFPISRTNSLLTAGHALYTWTMEMGKVAETLEQIATLLELKGENPFKTRAYVNAARALEAITEPLEKLIAEQRLAEVKG